jgi:hypothetical protein
MAFTFVTITRDYDLADGIDPVGEVSFTPTAPMTNGPTVVAAAVTRALDFDGLLSIPLAANTDPATTPVGTSYLVKEVIEGVSRSYYVQIPHNGGSVIDLSTLVTAPIPPVITYPAVGPAGPAGAAGATGPAGPSTVVQDEGGAVTQRSTINFTGTGVSVADDAVNSRTNVTIADRAVVFALIFGG